MTGTCQSHQTKLKVCLSPEGMAPALATHYAGEDETLRDDAVMFGEKAKAVGVDVALHIGEGMFHCYPATAPLFPEATRAFEEICAFVQERVSVQIPSETH